MKLLSKIFIAFTLLCLTYANAHASINLQDYTLCAGPTATPQISDDLSGLTYNSSTNTLFACTNGTETIYELDLNGTVLRTIPLIGFDDTEGLVWVGGTDYVITEERFGNLVYISITAATTSINYPTTVMSLSGPSGPGPWPGNDGLEGVAYDPASNELITIQETLPIPYSFVPPAGFTGTINPNIPFAIGFGFTDVAGLHHLGMNTYIPCGVNVSDRLLLLSEQEKTVVETDFTGTEHSRLSLTAGGANGTISTALPQPEGVTMDNQGNIYIVSEPNLFYKFSPATITPNPATNIVCNDNSTPLNPADDTYTFDILVNASNIAPGGTNTFNDNQGNTGIAYGTTVSYGPFPISGGNVTVNFTHIDASVSCTSMMTATAPSTCSNGACSITPDAATNIVCNDNNTPLNSADDTYTFDILVNGSNTDPAASNTFNDNLGNAGIAYGTTVSYGPFPISGGDATVNFTDADDANCTNMMMATAPSTCSNAACDVSIDCPMLLGKCTTSSFDCNPMPTGGGFSGSLVDTFGPGVIGTDGMINLSGIDDTGAAGQYTITYTYTDANGCTGTAECTFTLVVIPE